MTEANGPVLSPKEAKALDEFKERISDLMKPDYDDHFLKKWLVARCFNLEKSEQMFRTSIAYKEKMRVSSILEEYEPPEVLQKYLTGGLCGYDKDGSPVRVEMFGLLDMKGLMYSSKKSDLEKTKLLQCETIVHMWQKQTEKLGRRVDGLTVIFDMENVSSKALWRPGLQMYLHLVKVLEDNYPEMMKRMFVINAPRIFPLLWKVCRPLISEDMKRKIHVLGGDYKSHLLKYMDDDQLPAMFGGTLTDPDGNPRCSKWICQGGDVPREYYLTQNNESEMMTEITVPKGEKFKQKINVEKESSILRWEFRTEDYDIGFSVVYVDEGEKEVELMPYKRVNCHQVTEDDSVICEKKGIYMVVFDNSYSWTRAKTLWYLVEIHTSDDVTDLEVDKVSRGGSWTRLVNNTQITHL